MEEIANLENESQPSVRHFVGRYNEQEAIRYFCNHIHYVVTMNNRSVALGFLSPVIAYYHKRSAHLFKNVVTSHD